MRTCVDPSLEPGKPICDRHQESLCRVSMQDPHTFVTLEEPGLVLSELTDLKYVFVLITINRLSLVMTPKRDRESY